MEEVTWVFELSLKWVGFEHKEMGRERQSGQNCIVMDMENCRIFPKIRQ